MAAVLSHQPNMDRLYAEYLDRYPEDAGWHDGLIDRRLCVANAIAGEHSKYVAKGRARIENVELLDAERDQWDSSTNRLTLDPSILPRHLRWSGPLKYCPSGTLRFGIPEIKGHRARVYYENQSSWNGKGGQLHLLKSGDSWVVTADLNWWQV